MKKILFITIPLMLGIAFISALLFSQLMAAPSPEEIYPTLANQYLRDFKRNYDRYIMNHNSVPPESMSQLLDAGYLRNVVEPNRTRILAQLEFPITNALPSDISAPILAIFHYTEFGDFFLNLDGRVVEKRNSNYEPETDYKKKSKSVN